MKIKIDNNEIEVTPGETILEAAQQAGIDIPTLCYNKDYGDKGHCRMCMVEVTSNGSSRMVAACTYPIYSEIQVVTSTPVIEKIRCTIVMLLSKQAAGSKLVNDLAKKYKCSENSLTNHFEERCILCWLCVDACEKVGSGCIAPIRRGTQRKVSTPYDEDEFTCIGCGACAEVCPTGAIEVSDQGNARIIWNKTFELVNCAKCGKPFATKAQAEYAAVRNKGAADTFCENCRSKESA